MFSSCKKEEANQSENTDLVTKPFKSYYLKSNISTDMLVRQASMYSGKPLEETLEDLVIKKSISINAKETILKLFKNKNAESFKKEAKERMRIRAENNVKRNSFQLYASVYSRENNKDITLSDQQATEIFDYMMLDLVNTRGISWGCAGAIAGVGLSIASLFVGGPVTVAAAAIWGAGHIVSVLSLTACASSKMAHHLQETIEKTDEETFVKDFINNQELPIQNPQEPDTDLPIENDPYYIPKPNNPPLQPLR